MNEKQKAWLKDYVESGDAVGAVERCYPDVQAASRATKASYLKSTLATEIDKAARATYGKDAPLMLSIIKDLALTAKQDSVRLKAADTWLSRAGHDAPLQIQDTTQKASYDELIDRLKIASTGLPDDVISAVLGKELANTIKPKEEDKPNGQRLQ